LSIPVLHLLPLGASLLIAVAWDVRVRRIPNLVCGATAIAGLGLRFWDDGGLAALGGLGAGALTVALIYPFWRRGGIGGGDVKLAGAAAVGVGLSSALPIFWLATALAGGVTALVCLSMSRRSVRREIRANLTVAALHQVIPDIGPMVTGRVSVPYGVAIASGVVFVLWWRARG
jgi:prepilin peptidase CpaA